MRAIRVDRFGPPEVLEPVVLPEREPGPGEVSVAVAASDVGFVDTMIRSGAGTSFFAIRPPYVPGGGVAGQIVGAGDGVDGSLIGRLVVAHTGGTGGYAERVVIALSEVVEVPPGVDPLDALAVLHDGSTGIAVLRRVDVRSGEPVLVLGAAGGMGVLLVQALHAAGAFVIGAARGKAKLDVVEEAGADVVVDYGKPEWTSRVRDATNAAGPAVVLDGVGGSLGSEAFTMVRDGGRFSAHGAPSGTFAPIDPDVARRRGVTLITLADLGIDATTRSPLVREALALVGAGALTPLIGQTFPLGSASEAHRAMENRESIAKTLLMN